METATMLTTVLVALITAVIGPVVVAWARVKFTPSKPLEDKVKESIEAYAIVERELGELFSDLGCDRVWLAQFHNGGNFYPSGKSMIRFSFIFESHSRDVPSIKHVYQNLPASLFTKPLNHLLHNGYLKAKSNSNNDEFGLNSQLEETQTNKLYIIGLFSTQGKFVGMLGVGYKEEHKVTAEEWTQINQKAGATTLLLENYFQKV